MEYYEVQNTLTGVPRKVILHKQASDLEEACLLAGLAVGEVGQVDAALRRCTYLLRELLARGYQVKLPFGTFKGRLNSTMEYSISFKMDPTLQGTISTIATFEKVERPPNFISSVFSTFQSPAGTTSHSVVVRGQPVTIKGKFTYLTTFSMVNEAGAETPFNQITKSSSSLICRLDVPFSTPNGLSYVGNSLGNELPVPYSILPPIFLDPTKADLIYVIPYIGSVLGSGKTESDFYASSSNSLGVYLAINSTRSQFTFKLVQKTGAIQTDASTSQVVYPLSVASGKGIMMYLDFGVAVLGVHRANLLAYLNDFHRYTGFTNFFGA